MAAIASGPRTSPGCRPSRAAAATRARSRRWGSRPRSAPASRYRFGGRRARRAAGSSIVGPRPRRRASSLRRLAAARRGADRRRHRPGAAGGSPSGSGRAGSSPRSAMLNALRRPRAVRAGRRDRRVATPAARRCGSSAVRPTTSSPTRRWRRGSPSAGSSTRPISSPTLAGWSTSIASCAASTRTGRASTPAASRTRSARILAIAEDRGIDAARGRLRARPRAARRTPCETDRVAELRVDPRRPRPLRGGVSTAGGDRRRAPGGRRSRTCCCCSSIRPSTPAGAARRRTSCRWARTGTGCRGSRSSTPTAAGGHLPRPRPAGRLSDRQPRRARKARRRPRLRRRHGGGDDRGARRARRRGAPIDGLTGVWVGAEPPPAGDARKIGSIGIHISRGITTHGLAINVNNDLQPFEWIVPCGIEACRMTLARRASSAPSRTSTRSRRPVAERFARGLWRAGEAL